MAGDEGSVPSMEGYDSFSLIGRGGMASVWRARQMSLDRQVPENDGSKETVVPDVNSLGLKDAMYIIENSGLRCTYSGTGHVAGQSPAPGQKAAKGSSVTITLK